MDITGRDDKLMRASSQPLKRANVIQPKKAEREWTTCRHFSLIPSSNLLRSLYKKKKLTRNY